MLQDFPAPRLVPQLLASENGPVMVKLLMSRVAVPELLSVAVRSVKHTQPVLMMFLHSNVMLVGDSVAFAPVIAAVVVVPDPLGTEDVLGSGILFRDLSGRRNIRRIELF